MFSGGLMELILLVIRSWQVIVVTIVLVLIMYLVGYVANSYHHPKSVSRARPKKAKIQPKVNVKKQSSPDDLIIEEQ
jgi:Na+-transporting methylmalonyl-CoA/oxaloacetate decarboxylase gamma subunit